MVSRTSVSFIIILTLLAAPIGYVHAASFTTAGLRLNKKVKPMREIKRENVVSQSLDFSCGAAGLSTLMNYYLEDPVSEAEIINSLLNIVPLEKVKARKGFSLLDLKTFAKARGYKVTGYKMDVDFLKGLDKPVLVPIKFRNYRHFVIVKGVIGDRVFIADPAAGNMSMKIDKFEKMWNNGIALVVERTEPEETREYALKVKTDDLLVASYKLIRRLLDGSVMRTAIYPTEW